MSTIAYVVLYVALRGAMPALAANALALLVTAVANTAANRRVTFGVVSPGSHLRHQLQGIAVFAVGLALTSGALAALHDLAPRSGRALEVVVLVSTGAAATALRFVLFRSWVIPGSADPPPISPPTVPAPTVVPSPTAPARPVPSSPSGSHR